MKLNVCADDLLKQKENIFVYSYKKLSVGLSSRSAQSHLKKVLYTFHKWTNPALYYVLMSCFAQQNEQKNDNEL